MEEEQDESISSGGKYWRHQAADCSLGDDEEVVMMSAAEPLDDETPPRGEEEEAGPRRRRESMVNKLISTVYSGPTISDIERALSFTGVGEDHHHLNYSSSPAVVFSPEKVLSKMESKYTLKIKTCGNNGLAEDGYKWRKYGQKSIKNSPNPRSYYRCTNPRCNAKKQVERATDEPDTLVVTYEGLHLHYTYSHFLHAAQQQGLPKKPKTGPPPLHVPEASSQLDTVITGAGGPLAPPPAAAGDGAIPAAADWGYFDGHECSHHHRQQQQVAERTYIDGDEGDQQQQQQHVADDTNNNNGGGGLLEDVVPLLVRRPCGSTTTTTASPSPGEKENSSSSSSVSCSWTPTSPYIDMAILSNIF